MSKIYTRKVTPNEYFFVAANELSPPYANQFILDGTGVLDITKWRNAVEQASVANPGMRVVLKGSMLSSRWVDSGQTPGVWEVNGSNWSGLSSDGSPFLKYNLSLYKGPTCEVVLIQGNPLRVLFRTLHAVTDGGGTLLWMEDIFRSLRGEVPLGSDSIMTEVELARSYQKDYLKPVPDDSIPIFGKAQSNELGFVWRRRQFKGRYRQLLPRMVVLLAKEARKYNEGIFRVSIPVDMRFRMPGIRSTAHLSRSVNLEIDSDMSIDQVSEKIKKLIADKQEGLQASNLIRYLILMTPQRLLQMLLKEKLKKIHETGRYKFSALVTSLRMQTLDQYSGGGFHSTNFWVPPPCPDVFPAFLLFSTAPGDIVNMHLSVPRAFASVYDPDEILDRLVSGLNED